MTFDICVVGAGLVGLSAALSVQKLMRIANVTVIADSIGTETHTPVTAGLFMPVPSDVKNVDPFYIKEWYADGWNHHYDLAKNGEPEETGNLFKDGECLWWHDGLHVIKNNVMDYRDLTRDEMDEKEYFYAHGCKFTTVHVDIPIYLRWLFKQIRKNGGDIIFDTVFSFQELYGKYDLIINCVGTRGRELTADEHLHKTTGYMVQTTLIDVDRFFLTQDNIYVCPNLRTGLCDVGFIWNDSPTLESADEIRWLLIHNASKICPAISECEVVKDWVERRPERTPIRLEMELLNCGGPILPIVHNIGQGENTLSLAWGRGVHAAHLAQEVLRTSRPFAQQWPPFNKI